MNSLAHTRWTCKYHIVFTPKYRRKVIYNELRRNIQQIIKDLCKWKGVEIIEGHMMPDHIHLLVSIPPKMSVSEFMRYLKGKISGGAIVVINEDTRHNHLDFLYVKCGIQSKGVGQKIWNEIERLYPSTKVWETFTPYFEKRNIHFYINRLGFHAVEFFNPRHKDSNIPDDMVGGDYFFRFEKVIQ